MYNLSLAVDNFDSCYSSNAWQWSLETTPPLGFQCEAHIAPNKMGPLTKVIRSQKVVLAEYTALAGNFQQATIQILQKLESALVFIGFLGSWVETIVFVFFLPEWFIWNFIFFKKSWGHWLKSVLPNIIILISKVISTHLWSTPLNFLATGYKKGFLSSLANGNCRLGVRIAGVL